MHAHRFVATRLQNIRCSHPAGIGELTVIMNRGLASRKLRYKETGGVALGHLHRRDPKAEVVHLIAANTLYVLIRKPIPPQRTVVEPQPGLSEFPGRQFGVTE